MSKDKLGILHALLDYQGQSIIQLLLVKVVALQKIALSQGKTILVRKTV